MATYYWSNAGSDSNNGTSPSTSFATFTGSGKGAGAALSAGDLCLFKAGDIWYGSNAQITVASNGTVGSPIVFDRYGLASDPDPIFCGSVITSSWTSQGGNIYSKSGQGTVNTVGVDGEYALGRYGGSVTTLPARTFRNSSGTLYIRLEDDSNPSGHTIYVPQYFPSAYTALVRTNNSTGDYVQFNHFKIMYAQEIGGESKNLSVYFNDCHFLGNGRDGHTMNHNTGSSIDCTGSRAVRCIATYNNAGGAGYGQGFTVHGQSCWLINCTSAMNGMAGGDFLQEASPARNCIQSGAIYCVFFKNGQNPGSSGATTDSPLYIDGANNILVYGCTLHGAGIGTQASVASCLRIDNEHPDVQTVSNIHIINNLIYDTDYYCIQIANDINVSGSYKNLTGIELINNTFAKTNDIFGGCLSVLDLSTTDSLVMKNNIFAKTTGATYPPWRNMTAAALGTNVSRVTSDYNDWWRSTGTTLFTLDSVNKTWTDWQASPLSKDANGINSNPQFSLTNPTAWATTTLYSHGTYVTQSSLVYLCIVNHTSGTFATDLATHKWLLVDTFLDARLQRISLGESNDSPCIDVGVETPWTPPSWVTTAGVLTDNGAVVGSTRIDNVADDTTVSMDMGYHYYTPTPYGALVSADVQPATLYVATTNTCTITFTTANVWPSNGTLVTTFPTTLGGGFSFNSGGTSAATFNSGGDGSLAVSIVGNVVTLTRSGGTNIAASTSVSIAFTKVLNPPQVGSTGAYLMKTTTSAGAAIDIDINVSDDQIIDPPSNYVTITISGVTMSNVIISPA